MLQGINPKNINLYEIQKGEFTEEGIIFELNDDKRMISNETISIGDPAYDATFKKIFEEGNKMKHISGSQRLVNFLNSILYPNKSEEYIMKVNKVSNEITALNANDSTCLRFDISCEAEVGPGKKLIDIEMQLSNDPSMIERLFTYGSSLYKSTKKETIVIGLINGEKKNQKYDSSSIKLFQSYNKENKDNKQHELNFIKIIIINLKEEIENMKSGSKILINDKEIGEVGKNWIKFFGIRHWGFKDDKRYLLPNNIKLSSLELESALYIVRNVNNIQLEKMMNDEEYRLNMEKNKYEEGIEEGIEKGREEGKKEGREEGKKEGREEGEKIKTINCLINIFKKDEKGINELINCVCDEEFVFKKEDIKKQWIGEESRLEEFINLLGKKRKIE